MDSFFGPLFAGLSLMSGVGIWVVIVAGTLFGVVAGALPGIGTTLAYGLVLPFTFTMDVVPAIVLLLAVTVGVAYGNSIPAIILGVPGTPAAILTVLDGYALHKKGETGLALGLAFLGAVLGQLVSVFFFVAAVVPLSALAFHFLAPEMFALYFFGVVAIVSLTGKNIVKGFIAAVFGLLVGMIGTDPINAIPRFTMGMFTLRAGLNVPAVIIGLLAVGEIFRQTRQVFKWDSAEGERFEAKFPSFRAIRPTLLPMLGGTVVGTLVGAIPGAGGTPAALLSYQQAQIMSKHPEEFGKGSPEGVAANEAAQNGANSGELIPTLGLGIPGSGSMVLLLAAVSLHGFIPGPSLVREAPQLLAATIAGLVGGTFLLILTGWPMARILLKLLTLDRAIILVFALITVALGVYSIRYRVEDILICFLFGAVGYVMLRYGYSTAAAALAVVLSTGFESYLRRGLTLFGHDIVEILSRPITSGTLLLALLFLAIGIRRTHAQRRTEKGEASFTDVLISSTGESDDE